MPALQGYLANFYLSSPPSIATTNEAMTDVGDHISYVITNTAHQALDPTVAVVVQTSPDNGTTWSAITSGFIVQYSIGRVKFLAANASTVQVRIASANYVVVAFLGNAKSVDITNTVDIEDTTAWTNPPSQWKTKQSKLVGAAVKVNKWWVDATLMQYIGTNTLLLLVLYNGSNPTSRYVCYGLLKTDALKIAVDKLVEEDLDFEVSGPVYFLAS